MLFAGLWYMASARRYYDGPRTTLPDRDLPGDSKQAESSEDLKG
jgi:hypothetical protein